MLEGGLTGLCGPVVDILLLANARDHGWDTEQYLSEVLVAGFEESAEDQRTGRCSCLIEFWAAAASRVRAIHRDQSRNGRSGSQHVGTENHGSGTRHKKVPTLQPHHPPTASTSRGFVKMCPQEQSLDSQRINLNIKL